MEHDATAQTDYSLMMMMMMIMMMMVKTMTENLLQSGIRAN